MNLNDSAKSLSLPAIKRIIDQLVINQVPFITITGGEPFVKRTETFELIKLAEEAGMHISINSNFSLINALDIDFFSGTKKFINVG